MKNCWPFFTGWLKGARGGRATEAGSAIKPECCRSRSAALPRSICADAVLIVATRRDKVRGQHLKELEQRLAQERPIAFTGATVYDPNSNFRIPEFRLSKYELISANPGFLFWPGEKSGGRVLPPKHPPTF